MPRQRRDTRIDRPEPRPAGGHGPLVTESPSASPSAEPHGAKPATHIVTDGPNAGDRRPAEETSDVEDGVPTLPRHPAAA
ncbi:MAG: hypothetical protein J0L92_00885 [Deltaproteobacteria bacterium]|nr:hypothetical protein [Deltaproteobacteria bacterium]